MKTNLMKRLLCAFLSMLMVVCAIPAITISAAEERGEVADFDYTREEFTSEADRLAVMEKKFDNGEYALYYDAILGVVAYQKLSTGEVLFTNPWDMSAETCSDDSLRAEMLSQITLSYVDSKNTNWFLNSYVDAALKSQINVKPIKNGIRVEYAIGQISSRLLCPKQIERSSFEEKILAPMEAALGKTTHEFKQFKAYFEEMFYAERILASKKGAEDVVAQSMAAKFPVLAEKNINIYVLSASTTTAQMEHLADMIQTYCPDYSFEEMDRDYEYLGYIEELEAPPIFRMALEYTVDSNGLVVELPANGLRFDESAFRMTNLTVLPYMGACNKANEGYTFVPDGSGTLYEHSVPTLINGRVYGDDFALFSGISGLHSEVIRMPVFGQVETNAKGVKRGYFAIIEEGDSLATIAPIHLNYLQHTSVSLSFITRQQDKSVSNWSVYAARRYTDDYRIRYIMLSDDNKAKEANLTSYYECSWMGMAFAYRNYLASTNADFKRLGESDVKTSIPLYIEAFGCMDTVKKVMSMPVTVSVALTTFDDIQEMYTYLAGEKVTNVNFKLTGFANGGLYSEVPYKLKWEKAVGGKSDFKDLVADAAERGYGIFPDFDFVYTTSASASDSVNMKKNAARTIDNRYTARRIYSATKQAMVSYYQMLLSPATFSHFYEKLERRYSKYDAMGISLSTMGSALNSDYDEDKITLREEAKTYTMEALSYFNERDYDIMLDAANAYTWNYASHILNVPLDSSRYNAELSAIPFMGVVLHGYVEFAGSAFNEEGDLSYAMLKAIENGASLYFILSYANTELLKEDELLSQNYSVRYDIWQKRLVEIYNELNLALADVQTKLIIDHRFLDGNRVPNENELLDDILEAAKDKADQIADKIENDRIAAVAAIRAASEAAISAEATIKAQSTGIVDLRNRLHQQRSETSELIRIWNTCNGQGAEISASNLTTMTNAFTTLIARRSVNAAKALKLAEDALLAAKNGYDYLVANDAISQLVNEAEAALDKAVDAYVALLNEYRSEKVAISPENKLAFVKGSEATIEALRGKLTVTKTVADVSDADLAGFVFGTDAALSDKYEGLGVEALANAFIRQLIEEGYYDPADPTASKINVAAILAAVSGETETVPTPPPSEEEGGGNEGGTGGAEGEEVIVPDPPKDKYSLNQNLVLVTYGEVGSPYKSFILNFNDYTVQTTVNGVIYTIESYGYVVIYHNA